MSTPKVSVIVTTKNEEQNIDRFLDSIKKQTYKNLEIIVVDNNSTDKTKEISLKYTKKVFNRGPERSAQRNFGAKKAIGNYAAFFDADMILAPRVIESCVRTMRSGEYGALIIPEKTAGNNFIAKVRRFERDMYQGDPTIEVARFYDRKIFEELGGYDLGLTGAEDYDLPYRLSKKYQIGWSKISLTHDESSLSLMTLLRKKYYYAGKSVAYAEKHPDLVKTQGTILFRKAYLRNWRKFIREPFLGVSFIFIRIMTLIAAVLGYIRVVGIKSFFKTFLKIFK